jgi:hypothetical protein
MSVGEVYSAETGAGGSSARNQERISSLRQVLVALGAALTSSTSDGDLETVFERQVRQLLDLLGCRPSSRHRTTRCIH